MWAFAEAWADAEIVQQAAAQLPWGHNEVTHRRIPPTFIIARWIAPCDMPISRPGRILVFGIATVAAIQLLRTAAMAIDWKPFIVAVFNAGFYPALADFQENHPLATVAIVYVIQLPLALASVWCGARFALKCSRTSDLHEACRQDLITNGRDLRIKCCAPGGGAPVRCSFPPPP